MLDQFLPGFVPPFPTPTGNTSLLCKLFWEPAVGCPGETLATETVSRCNNDGEKLLFVIY